MSVMGIKLGTKPWSDARQNELTKVDGLKTNSAEDLKKLGDQDIGDVLNKIADPNWVDPQKKIRAVGSDKMDKDAFMKLMLAQMKNQDPSNPLKSHEMAAQLAQFTSLEQLQNMNSTLSEIQKGQKPTESFQALNFIGKSVSGDSAKILRMKGDKDHDVSFNMPDIAKDVSIKVTNELGEVIRKVDIPTMKKGDNRWVWNGRSDNDVATPVGQYVVSIEAKTTGDKKMAVKTEFSGLISGVTYSAEGPILMVGNQAVKLKDVRKIVDGNIATKGQNPQQDLKAQPPASENKNKTEEKNLTEAKAKTDAKDDQGAQEKPVMTSNLAEGVAMTNGMMEKLKRDLSAPSTTESALANPANAAHAANVGNAVQVALQPAAKDKEKAPQKGNPSATL